MVEADVRGRTLTSFPSARNEIRKAGTRAWSSAAPPLPAFFSQIVEEFAEGRQPVGAQT
ncbi:hypothetical protein GCM10027271_02350 [Saccharopolyspora gloriosae]